MGRIDSTMASIAFFQESLGFRARQRELWPHHPLEQGDEENTSEATPERVSLACPKKDLPQFRAYDPLADV
jgi:hypothetical protein